MTSPPTGERPDFGSRWEFPPLEQVTARGDLIAIGADLAKTTLLDAYSSGYFPMPVDGEIGWFSPDPRGVLPLDGLKVSRSLNRSLRRFRVTIDVAFEQVVECCADPRRPHGWITPAIVDAYCALHRGGWAHSVEVWDDDGLAGGLYGVSIRGLFAGESMFHRATDASKVALVHLVELLRPAVSSLGQPLLDVQWATPHLESLGVVSISRHEYGRRLDAALRLPTAPTFSHHS